MGSVHAIVLRLQVSALDAPTEKSNATKEVQQLAVDFLCKHWQTDIRCLEGNQAEDILIDEWPRRTDDTSQKQDHNQLNTLLLHLV